MDVTENGWPGLPATEDMLNWVTVPGTNPPVKLNIQKGQPTQLLRAFAADFSAYVEPLEDPDTACYTHDNSVWNSNHRSGTALDLNWDRHPFHVSYAGFPQDKINAMRDLLKFYTIDGLPLIYWGQDWGLQGIGPFDPMHIQCNGNTYNNPKTATWIAKNIRADGFSTYKRGPMTAPDTAVLATAVTPTGPVEKVLPYNHAQQAVAQELGYDCCPASCQVVLDGLGVHMSENELIKAIGTTQNGTNTVEQALPILNEKAGAGGKWVAQWMPNDPPRPDQVEALWHNVKTSIDAGHGCVLNFEVPSGNFPRGTRGSVSPQYRGSKVWHYVSCMGYADDGPGGRHLWIADPGFGPFDKGGYFMSLQQAATAIPPHAYAYFVPNVVAPVPAPAKAPLPPVVQPVAPPVAAPVAIQAPVAAIAASAGELGEFWAEWAAIELGDVDSICHVIRAAASQAAPEIVHRARAVLAKVPRPALADALARTDPALLTALTGRVA